MSLCDEQIQHLAQILIEDYGSDLYENQLAEQIGLLLEDIAGFDTADDDTTSQLIQQIGSVYHGSKTHR